MLLPSSVLISDADVCISANTDSHDSHYNVDCKNHPTINLDRTVGHEADMISPNYPSKYENRVDVTRVFETEAFRGFLSLEIVSLKASQGCHNSCSASRNE